MNYLPKSILETENQFSFESINNSNSQQIEPNQLSNVEKTPTNKSLDLSAYLMGKNATFSPQSHNHNIDRKKVSVPSIEELVEKSFQRRSQDTQKSPDVYNSNFQMKKIQQLDDLKAKMAAYYKKEKKDDYGDDKDFILGIRGKLQNLSDKMEGIGPIKAQKANKGTI